MAAWSSGTVRVAHSSSSSLTDLSSHFSHVSGSTAAPGVVESGAVVSGAAEPPVSADARSVAVTPASVLHPARVSNAAAMNSREPARMAGTVLGVRARVAAPLGGQRERSGLAAEELQELGLQVVALDDSIFGPNTPGARMMLSIGCITS